VASLARMWRRFLNKDERPRQRGRGQKGSDTLVFPHRVGLEPLVAVVRASLRIVMQIEGAIDTVPLGRSGLGVTRFCLGCAPLGWPEDVVSDRTSEEVLTAAWEQGVRAFDTAPHYGAGLSEQRLGNFMRRMDRDTFVISTKVGRLLVPRDDGERGSVGEKHTRRMFDFSRSGVRASLDQSLERMCLDRVDIALIHDPDDHMEAALTQAYVELENLRAEGIVRAIGVGANHVDICERFVRDTDIDCVLIAGRYSLLDDRAGDSLLPIAKDRGIGVLVGGVFNSGILAKPAPEATFDYLPASRSMVERVRHIEAIANRYGVSIRQAATHFALRGAGVSAVAVGACTAQEVREDIADLRSPVPAQLWEELASSGLLGYRRH
jgi:D-threo-aldose 1-dehydrogenase